MAVKDINDQTFAEATATGVSITDFWATWCAPCKMQGPVISALANQVKDVDFFKIDVDENKETASELGIRAIPTLIIKKDGEIVERLTGYTPAPQLTEILNKYTDQ
ncbi:MAG: thioredoxin [Lactobacillaceae bacterium]|jgi:thioredoxin 1|nr:thioredoxin [Lactobacillaceae bacterium]